MIPRFDLVVFDWDGTLMPSTGAIIEAFAYAAKALGYPVPDADKTRRAIGMGRADAMHFLMPDCPERCWGTFEETYRTFYLEKEKTLTLFPGVRELLRELHAGDVKIALATGKSERGIGRVLTRTNLTALFDATRAGNVLNPKPQPGMILDICRELGVALNRTVMVGDSTLDLRMAANAGVSGIGVTYGACTQEELTALPHAGLADSVLQLQALLFE